MNKRSYVVLAYDYMSRRSYVNWNYAAGEKRQLAGSYANTISPVSAFMDFTMASDSTW